MGTDESGVMRGRNLLAFLVLLVLPGVVSAQGNTYGMLTCGPAAEQNSAPPSDKFGPARATLQPACTWLEPLKIGGSSSKDAQKTSQAGVQEAKSQETAYVVHMANGDQVTLRFSGRSSLSGTGDSRSLEGTWTLANGTGALKGITGHGTYTGLPRAAGGTSYDIEGQSSLPANAPPVAQNRPPD
jgi:hypothetical protein